MEFNEIVPFYKNDWKAYSPRLYSILQLACSQVESMIKRIVEELGGISKPQKSLFPYYRKLNANKLLEKQIVILIPAWQIIRPFKDQSLPQWWTAYNDTKHKIPYGVFSGTIENTIHAMAGLYCLHNLAFLIMYGNAYDVTKDENWSEWTYPKFPNRDVDSFNARTPEITHKWKSMMFHHTRFYLDATKPNET